ncbi:MAG: ATPase, partial [Streptosporangiaceae bacterium]
LDPADLAAAASGSLDVTELAVGLKAAGISDNHGLAVDLMTELREHALQVALQNRERDELLTAGQPHYELPMIPDGIDLAGLYQLAATLRKQGAA